MERSLNFFLVWIVLQLEELYVFLVSELLVCNHGLKIPLQNTGSARFFLFTWQNLFNRPLPFERDPASFRLPLRSSEFFSEPFLTKRAMKKPSLSSTGSVRSRCSAAREKTRNSYKGLNFILHNSFSNTRLHSIESNQEFYTKQYNNDSQKHLQPSKTGRPRRCH